LVLELSEGDVEVRVFSNFYPTLSGAGRQPRQPFSAHVFCKLGQNPRVLTCDWLSSIPGVKIMAQNSIFGNNKKVTQKVSLAICHMAKKVSSMIMAGAGVENYFQNNC